MKKYLLFILVMLIAVFAMAGCGGLGSSSGQSDELSADSLKTIGDVIALEKGENQSAVGGGMVVYAFKYGDTYYRVKADMPEETQQAYFDVDIMEEGYEEKQQELIEPLEINLFERLSDQILTQDELDALTGKTGQELIDAGWTYNGSFVLDEMKLWMGYGPFVYSVIFDGDADPSDNENFDAEQSTKDMKVKSAEFSGMGDATTIEEQ